MPDFIDLFQRLGDSLHLVPELIKQHGSLFYLITFIWTFVEGETFVIFAGYFAQKGLLNIWLLFLAAWIGTFLGDQAAFWIGRHLGIKSLKRMPKIRPSVEKALDWLERYAVIFILAYRFMYGIRNVSGFAIGMSHISWKKFATWNFIAAGLWAAAFSGFGYLFGDVLKRIQNKQEVVDSSLWQMTLAVLALVAFVIVLRLVMMRLHNK